ncbi:hypothetical protein NVP1151O_55 [Vibrio phage 1.151.O._10N.222.46.B1]|nr:hypothetical protein NVP1151O_55 [Vibrio phage 1.151.O._10N.222.46.B1]
MSNKEWNNGEECHIDGYGVRLFTFGCDCPNPADNCIVFTESGNGHMVVSKAKLVKPKSEDEKRNDNGYSLFSIARSLEVKLSVGWIQTWDQLTPEMIEYWCAFAEKLGHKAE